MIAAKASEKLVKFLCENCDSEKLIQDKVCAYLQNLIKIIYFNFSPSGSENCWTVPYKSLCGLCLAVLAQDIH